MCWTLNLGKPFTTPLVVPAVCFWRRFIMYVSKVATHDY